MMNPDDVLEQARRRGTPLIAADQATFVWEGASAPLLMADFNDWAADHESGRMQQIAPGVWTRTITLPTDAYIEYFYGNGEDQRLLDPFNRRRVSNGVGHFQNYFAMPDKRSAREARKPPRAIPQGTVIRHVVSQPLAVAGGGRDVWLYAPPVNEPVPLLVVYDGRDYLRRARLPYIVDHLIAEKRIRPLAMALIHNAGQMRFTEYNTGETALALVMNLALPLAQKHLNLLNVDKNPGAYGVLGASMGGLMALYTGLRLPHVFGHVISQSGAFEQAWAFDTPSPHLKPLIHVLVEIAPVVPLKIWQDVGRFEWLLQPNRAMRALLKRKGYHVDYHEFNGGHNYPSWRDMLPSALESIFAP